MTAPLKKLVVLALLTGAVSAGFIGGRRLRQASGPWRNGVRAMTVAGNNGSGRPGYAGYGDSPMGADAAPADVFDSVLGHVQRDYVDGVKSNLTLSSGAVQMMLASLNDPKTYYLDPDMRRIYQQALAGYFHGVGAMFSVTRTRENDVDYQRLTVVATMPGSPAEKAGIKSGDYITNINAHWVIAYSVRVDFVRITKTQKPDAEKRDEIKAVAEKFTKGYSVDKALGMLCVGTDKPIKLTVARPGRKDAEDLQITTAALIVDPVEFHMVADHIGYLRVRQFNDRATREFASAFTKHGAALRGLIIDLRSNPGGVRAEAASGVNGYDSMLKLVGALAGSRAVADLAHHPGKKTPVHAIPLAQLAYHLKTAVLVDNGTANIAEIAAVGLRTCGAKVLGRNTFGDDTLESFSVLGNGAGMNINNGRLFTLDGASLEKGVAPDVALDPGASESESINRAVALLRGA